MAVNTGFITSDDFQVSPRSGETPPLVAVIVPAFKAEKYIGDCIRSVLAQSESRWHLVVVDDGSPDNSGEIAAGFARHDKRISVVRRENGGLSVARNTGLELAPPTPFVTFLDADDVLHPEFLSVLLSLQQKSADRISCVAHFRFPASESLNENLADGEYTLFSKYAQATAPDLSVGCHYATEEAVRRILYQRELDHSACGKLYPRHLVPPGIFNKGIGYEDLDAFYRIFRDAREVVFLPAPLYGYRYNPESYTNTFNVRRADVLDVAERMERYMQMENPSLLPAARSRLLSAYFNILALAAASGRNYDDLIKRSIIGIRRLRRAALFDRNVRLKNKAAIIVSYLGGLPLLKLLARLSPRY